MKLRIVSDLHLEFCDFNLPDQDDDKNTVLILAGDIGLVHAANLHERYIPFLSRCNIQFRKTILIAGNHEHYNGNFRKTVADLRGAIASANLENIVHLEKEWFEIDDVVLIGATLWTDCAKGDPSAFVHFQRMSDSRVIWNGGDGERKFTVEDSIADHRRAVGFIEAMVQHAHDNGKKPVVVVHHGVTDKSIHPKYAGDKMNMFFASELTDLWLSIKPALIVHGHTHSTMDYFVQDNNIRVIANPRGYARNLIDPPENESFDPNLTVEV